MSSDETQISHEGELDINGMIISCYVLKNGDRILSTAGMQNALGLEKGKDQRSSGRLDEILSSKAVSPFVSDDKTSAKYKPITCHRGKQKISAFKAEMLPEICEILLKVRDFAKENGLELGSRQLSVIEHADIIIRSLAKVGIVALVDEATGYQYERERNELQAILKALISDEILEYQKQFQLSFYREIFRLWGIPFTPQNIKRKPQFIGHLTNKFVYSNLPKGSFVLDALKAKTPKTESGNYKVRLHQSLTEDVGREALKKVLYSVEAIASISKDKAEFERLMNEKYGQKELPFSELDPES